MSAVEEDQMLVSIVLLLLGIGLGAGGILFGIRLRSHLVHGNGAVQPWRTIAVPIVDRTLPTAALSVAARLSAAARGDVVLLAVVQVPRTMAIDTEAPPSLESALSRLEDAERVVRDLGARVHGEVVRVRQISDLVGRACAETGAQVVVVEPDRASPGAIELLRALVEAKGPNPLDLVIAHQRPSALPPNER